MPNFMIDSLSPDEHAALSTQAAKHGRSMEVDARFDPRRSKVHPLMPSVEDRVERAQARVRSLFGGHAPLGLVDDFIVDRRMAAERGQ